MNQGTTKKVWAQPNPPTPGRPVLLDPNICTGCNKCVEVCPMDIFIANPDKGKPPILLHPDECWYCGCCVLDCPKPGAIKSNFPLMWRVPWKRKTTGEHAWVGMKRRRAN